MSAPSKTFNAYMYKSFLLWLVAMVSGLGFVIFLSNLVEMLRKTSDLPNVEMSDVTLLSALQVPALMQEVLPILVFFAVVGCLWWRTRSQELVVARATGLSIWQILKPISLAALFVGALFSSVFNPLTVISTEKFEALESSFFGRSAPVLKVTGGSFWLKENLDEGGSRIIRARGVKDRKANILLTKVDVFSVSSDSRLRTNLYARHLILTDSKLSLRQVIDKTDPDNPVQIANQVLETTLKLEDARPSVDKGTRPNFWNYKSRIENIKEPPAFTREPRLKYAKLLSLPFLLVSLVMLAALFSLRMQRKGSTGFLILSGIVVALALHFVSDIFYSFGLAGRMSVPVAIWTMPLIIGLLSVSFLLRSEDG